MKRILFVYLFGMINILQGQNPSNLDTSFGTGGKVFTDFNSGSEVGNALLLQPDGKILLAGTGLAISANAYDFCIARYNSNGTLDTSFGNNGKANFEITNYNNSYKRDYATGIALQTDGKIIMGGYCPDANFSSADNEFAVIRLTANGVLDTSYATNGILRFGFGSANCQAHTIAIQPDNKVVIAGYSSTSSSDYDYAVARINTDGTLDTDFSNDGKAVVNLGQYDKANAISIQTDGKIIISGDAGGKIGLVRFTEYGNLDTTFGTSGKVITDITPGSEDVTSTVLLPDEKLLCAGGRYNSSSNFLVAQYNTNGTLDTTFGTDGYADVDLDNESGDSAKAIALQTDGKFIVVGDCYTDGVSYFGVTRFNANGTLDTSFSGDGIQLTTMNSADANDVCIQPDGKIIVGGGNYLGGGNTGNFALARYLGDSYLATNEFETDNFIKIYPNPASNHLNILFTNNISENETYTITDLNARVIKKGILSLENNTIAIDNLNPGIYFFTIDTNPKTYKFIKK